MVRQSAEAPRRISQEPVDIEFEEVGEDSEAAAEVLARTFGEVVGGAGETGLRGKREAKEVQRRIEARLDNLARMFSSKADQVEEEDEEEG